MSLSDSDEERRAQYAGRQEFIVIKLIRWKVEERVLERIGKVMRLPDGRQTKGANLGWCDELKGWQKTRALRHACYNDGSYEQFMAGGEQSGKPQE